MGDDAVREGNGRLIGAGVQVVVTVRQRDVALVTDVMWRCGATGVEEQGDGPRTRLLGGFGERAGAAAAAASLERGGFPDASVVEVDPDAINRWRDHAAPVVAGPFVLAPAWLPPATDHAGQQVLWLDPGPTFGSGSHATTRLVIVALDRLVPPAETVLDVGCGSGVLGIASALLGAASVVGIDIDPAAPAVTATNAARNGVSDRLDVSTRSLADLVADGARFDVVLANLLAPILRDLAPHLVAAVGPEGNLVVSGLLADRWEATVDLLAPLSVTSVDQDDGWVAVTLACADHRRSPPS